MIEVAIADDHAVVRAGVGLILDQTGDIQLKFAASSSRELLQWLADHTADVIILDISMPGKDGLDTLKDLMLQHPGIPVIIFTMNAERHFRTRMMRNGAYAFINKEESSEVLLKTIRDAAAGIPRKIDWYEDQETEEESGSLPHDELSDREFQVLRLLAQGLKTQEIANMLSLSKNTVQNHRNHILTKMNFDTSTELIRYALKYGLIE